ncbi:MAG: hypothetical protein COV74_09855 [Candidatus Omnitrophica bacterium CG11_big_fil_rev_8_21_14_0_20_45_26]|uniref:GDP-perosamine synthase n=1 Tax=Candidatus Abzuiibacterium crystallinum TaxID=1974748 RepID=A0A2H0LLI6_9BACT|nr:MAG: hypothetical protein COV74_09855 [Candidatus Omnitrophica bacterium CG11_big_fil_rev_8_21_14_0_20_45_26]PIW64510.1 MAG: hypothetical protein COW12_05980 [Candidatus Omnitrophica bacterium CG12_big_fil_rev_8_21_14_0_65_45_16]
MIPVCEPLLDGNEEKYILEAVRSTWISSAGRFITDFEEQMSTYCGTRFGVSCSSGTTALHLACLALGIGPGDEVIIPTFTLIVSANVVIACGAKPVLVDSDPDTWCIDPQKIEEKITSKTKAIMAVHMYGHPCAMDSIMMLAQKHGLKVIEDCAEAHGATYQGKKVGSFGDVGAFSFYGNKILTTGEGGMLLTNDKTIAAKARLLRNQAFEEPRFVHREIGYNYRLTNVQAAIGLAQLERIKQKIAKKRHIAATYEKLLKSADLTLPVEKPQSLNVYWMYGIVLGSSYGTKDEVVKRLGQNGIQTRSFFCPMHQQPVYRSGSSLFPKVDGHYPVADHLFKRGFYLPSGLPLSDDQLTEVAEQLLACRKTTLSA